MRPPHLPASRPPRVIVISSDCAAANGSAARAAGAVAFFAKDDLVGLPFREAIGG